MLGRRTDLALEAKEIWEEGAAEAAVLEGVEAASGEREGFHTETVRILDRRGEEALGKPAGRYVTLTLDGLARREEGAFGRAARAVAGELAGLMEGVPTGGLALVVGLGNRAITPDALGPKVHDYTLVTRHLVEGCPEHFGGFRPVAALVRRGAGHHGDGERRAGPGGMPPAEAGLCGGGGRPGLPVPEAAVPHGAVVRYRDRPRLRGGQPPGGAGPGLSGCAGAGGGGPHSGGRGHPGRRSAGTAELPPLGEGRDLLVTPKDIDSQVSDLAKVIGYGIGLALHPGLRVEDLDLLLS